MKVGVKPWAHIGDALFLTGAVRNIRLKYPEIKFVWLGRDYYKPLIDRNPDFVEGVPDVVLPTVRYGDGENVAKHGAHIQAEAEYICNALQIAPVPFSVKTPIVYLSEEEMLSGAIYKGWWLVNANYQTISVSKHYPHWVEVAEGMHELGFQFAQLGGNEERDVSVTLPHALDLRGKTTLKQWLAMIANCEGIVSPPSGIMNAGAIWNKPMVIVTGARELPAITNYPTAKYITSDCEFKGCEAQKPEQCRYYKDGVCRCMDMPASRILDAIKAITGISFQTGCSSQV